LIYRYLTTCKERPHNPPHRKDNFAIQIIMATMPLFHNTESLSAEDQILFNKFGRGPQVEVPFLLIQDAFESFVDSQPHAIAADHNGETITYRELDNAANMLANKLINNGLQPRQRVCLVVQRSIPMLVALLAVLKCGCQYIPLDGGVAPDDTLHHVLNDTAARYILCLGRFKDRVTPFLKPTSHVIVLDDPKEEELNPSIKRPCVSVQPSDGAYMIYTSGKQPTL
jgi:non-ribosomal peptide synthetase component F